MFFFKIRYSLAVCVQTLFTVSSEGDRHDSDRRGHRDICVTAAGLTKDLTHLVHWPEYFLFTHTHTQKPLSLNIFFIYVLQRVWSDRRSVCVFFLGFMKCVTF